MPEARFGYDCSDNFGLSGAVRSVAAYRPRGVGGFGRDGPNPPFVASLAAAVQLPRTDIRRAGSILVGRKVAERT